MIIQEMYDKGIRCKGRGFNCNGCKDKNVCIEYTDNGFDFSKLTTKYIKLRCDKHHCDTDFLVKINDEFVQDFYCCPICNGMVFIFGEENIVEI